MRLVGSDGAREFVERRAEPASVGCFGGDVVVAAPDVLHEGVAGGDGSGGLEVLKAAHRAKPGLEPAMVRLDSLR
jgi:hypothetical protein